MTTEIPLTQARDQLAELVNRVAYGHERIILTRHSKPVACLVPPEDLQRLGPEGHEAISLTSTGQPPEMSQPAGMATPLRIAAQHQPPGQPEACPARADPGVSPTCRAASVAGANGLPGAALSSKKLIVLHIY